MPRLNDIEALKIAVDIELRGADLYARAQRLAQTPEMKRFFAGLQDEELQHAALFGALRDEALADESATAEYSSEGALFLSAFAAEIVFTGGLTRLASGDGLLSPVSALEEAVESEKNSILYYQAVMDASPNPRIRSALAEIAAEERGHLGQLLMRLNEARGIS